MGFESSESAGPLMFDVPTDVYFLLFLVLIAPTPCRHEIFRCVRMVANGNSAIATSKMDGVAFRYLEPVFVVGGFLTDHFADEAGLRRYWRSGNHINWYTIQHIPFKVFY